MAKLPSWYTADRAEQDLQGTRYAGVSDAEQRGPTRRPNVENILRLLAEQRARTSGTPYVPSKDGSERPYALTHEQWLAAQNGGAVKPTQDIGILDQYATPETAPQQDPQSRNGTVLTPNINSSDPSYTSRLLPVEAQRIAREGGVFSRPYAETFQMQPRGGTGSVATTARTEGYSYVTATQTDVAGEYYSLPMKVRQQFERTAQTLGRYPGEKSAVTLYGDMLVDSGKLATQGVLMAPEEVLFAKIMAGELSAGAPEKQDSSSGGGGGYGGGGAGGGTVQLTTPQQARYYIQQAYKSLLGRNPTDQEVDQFITVLRQAELGNPQTTEVIGGVTAVTGGFEPQILAEQMAKAESDYKTRGNWNYYSMFMDALAGN